MPVVSKKFSITVPDVVYEQLERWADEQGRPAANLAAFLIETGIRQAIERGELEAKPVKKTKEREG